MRAGQDGIGTMLTLERTRTELDTLAALAVPAPEPIADAVIVDRVSKHFVRRSRLRRQPNKEVRAVDGVVIVEDEGGEEHALGENLARAIFVQTAPEGASESAEAQ